MATLALSVAGASLGSLSGIGAGTGWQIGSALGRVFFSEEEGRGSRLTDLKFSGASYGVSIPRLFGTMRLGGNILWAAPLQSQARQAQSGGKGGVSASSGSSGYDYFASFAVGFAEGPVGDILKIWADGNILYDTTSVGDVRRPDLDFRFYNGSEDQLADSIILAVEGKGQAPAYRGLSYLVFDTLPISEYGNRIPNIEVLLSMEGVPHYPQTTGQDIALSPSSLWYDEEKGALYSYEVTGGVNKMRKLSVDPLAITHEASVGAEFPALPSSIDGFSVNRSGDFWIGTGYALLPGRAITRFSSQAMTKIQSMPLPDDVGAVTWSTDIFSAVQTDRFQVAGSQQSAQAIVFRENLAVLKVFETGSPACSGAVTDQNEVAWISMSGLLSSSPFAALQIMSVRLFAAPGIDGTDYDAGSDIYTIPRIDLTPGDPSETNCVTRMVAYLKDRQELVFQNDYRLFKWSMIHHQITVIRDDASLGKISRMHRTDGDELVYLEGGRWIVYLSAETFQEKERVDLYAFSDVGPLTGYIYDALSDSVVVTAADRPLARLYLRRQNGASADMAALVQNLGEAAGISPSDLDTSALSGAIPGYILNRPMSAQDALKPVLIAGHFDLSETGYTLTCVPRNAVAEIEISSETLLAPLRQQRLQESELPGSVSLNYMAADGGYQTGSQIAKRSYAPHATMFGRNSTILDLPMALDASAAKSICQRNLFSAWSERQIMGAGLPLRYLMLDPSDVVTIKEGKTVFTGRISQTYLGADLTQEIEAVCLREEKSEGLPADAGDGHVQVSIKRPANTELFILDLPLLRDEDATTGQGSRFYYAMDGYGSQWKGAALFRSETGDRFMQRGALENRVGWGAAVSKLPGTDTPWQTDHEHSLRVRFLRGEDRLETITREALLAGGNALLVGEELVQFAEVIANADGTHTLSTFLRGRRGTESAIDTHSIGEKVILLDPQTLGREIAALSDLDRTLFYKAVGPGQLFEQVPPFRTLLEGRDLKPYAPVHLTGSRSTDSLTLSWVRRTRIGGGALSKPVPVSEAFECYEIVFSYDGKEARKFIQAETGFDYSLEAFNQDFSVSVSEIPVLDITLYQLSEAVGRGYPAKEVL